MCVIQVKIHTHSDGRRSTKEKVRHCHEGKRRGSLCDHVERKGDVPVTISTSSSSRPSSSADMVTLGRYGKERHYHRVSKNGNKQYSLGTSSTNARTSSDTTPQSSSPSIREVRPSTSHDDRPRRIIRYSYVAPHGPNRTVGPDGTATYERPPSLELSRATGMIERPCSTINAGLHEVSSTTRPQPRRQRPTAIIVDMGASMTSTIPSLNPVSPGLSNLPRFGNDSANDLPLRHQARVDSLADDDEFEIHYSQEENDRLAGVERERLAASERYQQERISRELNDRELAQVQIERDRMAESERRQAARVSRQVDAEQAQLERDRLAESDWRRDELQTGARDEDQARRGSARIESDRRRRNRLGQEAESQARARAEEARRESHRQDAAAALERDEEDAEHERRVNAEFAQRARERTSADAQILAAGTPQYYEQPRSMPVSPRRITYSAVPPSPISTRQVTNSHITTPPAFSTRYPVTVHNSYSSIPRDSLRETGDAVIARTQAEAAQNSTQGLSSSMARIELPDDEMDAGMQYSSSRRQTGEVRERERVKVRRYEREYY